MRSENNRRRIFTRRAFVLGSAKLGLFGALAGRLYYLQMMKGQEFKSLSASNRIRLVLTPPDRGLITDRTGAPIARNEQNYQLYYDRTYRRNREKQFGILAEIMGTTAEALEKQLRRQRHIGHNALLAEHLTWEQVSAIAVRAPELPGAEVEVGTVRIYPYPEQTSHFVGYVGAANEKDEAEATVFKRLPELKLGKQGIEKQFEESLRGTPGVKRQEVNAHGRIMQEMVTSQSIAGEELPLSINMELQQIVYNRLAQERSASAIIMDIYTGEVLAYASYPGFDPNEFSRGISQKAWDALLASEQTPLMNKPIAGQYPPGSTYKMITGLAGLMEKKATPTTRFYCPGHMDLGNHRFHCWKRVGHGWMNLEEALEQSCDVYFYNIALMTGYDAVAKVARLFGFDQKTGIELPGEKTGIIPDSQWKRGRYGQEWRKGDSVNASIGQGYVLTTPLQLAVMTARIANGGRVITPTLRKATTRPDPKDLPSLDIPAPHMAIIRAGMEGVTGGPTGTAFYRRITEPGFEMAGKTGTAQVRSLKGIAHGSKRPWKHEHHALFVCYAPVHNPRYACSVVVEHGGGGSATAAPVAAEIMLEAQKIMARKPSLLPAMPPHLDPRTKPKTTTETAPTSNNAQQEDASPEEVPQ